MLTRNATATLFAAILVSIIVCLVVSSKRPVQEHQQAPRQLPAPPTPMAETSVASWMLQLDGYVRHCITGNIIGRAPRNFMTKHFTVSSTIREATNNLSHSFKNVFDKRVWGTEANPDFKGPIASGEFNC
jgi:hypothetical protein